MNMKKSALLILTLAAVSVAGFYAFQKNSSPDVSGKKYPEYKNLAYTVAGQKIQLVNGVAETEAAPGSASKIITRYFGNEVFHDFNGDGREDVAGIITQETGGSGMFYYVVAALNTPDGYVGSEAVLLGDRISPQTTEIVDNRLVVVNYADRAPGESFAVAPSVAKSIQLFLDVDAMQFGEVVKDFEGEADPSKMSLGMKSWTWVSTTYGDGKKVTPRQSLAFTIEFLKGGEFSVTTDCNRMAGKYKTNQAEIVISDMISTKMFCEGSQEAEFAKMLSESQIYHFTSKGQLILDLKYDSGSVIFR